MPAVVHDHNGAVVKVVVLGKLQDVEGALAEKRGVSQRRVYAAVNGGRGDREDGYRGGGEGDSGLPVGGGRSEILSTTADADDGSQDEYKKSYAIHG